MLFDGLERRGAFAAFVQETWRVGEEAYEQQGRGSLGLGIVLLSILPKKGDLRLPGNYRGIMMLEVAYKIVSIVLNARLQPVAESLDDDESQCGFRPLRGCSDASFTVKQLLRKRREHGQI